MSLPGSIRTRKMGSFGTNLTTEMCVMYACVHMHTHRLRKGKSWARQITQMSFMLEENIPDTRGSDKGCSCTEDGREMLRQ